MDTYYNIEIEEIMKSFWIRTTSILLIAGAVLAYDGCLQIREQNQQIADLTAQVEAYEQWESEVRATLESAAAAAQASSSDTPVAAEEEEGFKDGTYSGSAQGFGGQVSVDVTIKKGKISGIEITSASGEDSAYLSMAKKVIDTIVKEQSVDVDTISGATFSSTGIINAVAEALSEAWQ